MNLTTLAQQISDSTQIGKNDIQLILNKAFSVLMDENAQTTLTSPQNGTVPELNYLISRIQS